LGAQASWFVGASYGGTDVQLPRFLSVGIWGNGYDDKHLDMIRSMRLGDRIAINSSYKRNHGLTFESRGQAVSVMTTKAIGKTSFPYSSRNREKFRKNALLKVSMLDRQSLNQR